MDESKVKTGQELAKRDDSLVKPRVFAQYMESYKKQIAMLLPKHVDANQLIAISVMALQRNEKLQQCDRKSLANAVLKCAQAGLLPDGEHAIIVPYWNSNEGYFQAQFQAMYSGLLRQAYQEEKIKTVLAYEVYEADEFEVELGEHPTVTHRPYTKGLRGDIIGAYGIVFLEGSDIPIVDYVDFARLKKIRGVSKSPAWHQWPERMAKKTGLTSVLKYVPKSKELAMSISFTEQSEMELPQTDLNLDSETVLETKQPGGPGLPRTDGDGSARTVTRVKKGSDTGQSDKPGSDEPQQTNGPEDLGQNPSELTAEELAEAEAQAERAAIADESDDIPFGQPQSAAEKLRSKSNQSKLF